MSRARLVTKSLAKKTTAAALAGLIARNGWSYGDAGDALGCSDGTIANRLRGDDPEKQMTVYELLRSIVVDGPAMANAIFGEVEHHVARTHCETVPDAIAAAGGAARCAADLIAAAPGGIDRAEAEQLLPAIVEQRLSMAGLEAYLRSIIAGTT